MENLTKQLQIGYTKGAAIDDGEWEKIKALMVNPGQFEQKDIRVYESQLAHNFVDRDGERFSLPVLKSFAKTIVGKSVLTGHDWGSVGSGRVFDAKLEKATIPETLSMIGAHPEKGVQRQLAKVNDADGAIYWLITKYYTLAEDPINKLIDAGIVKDMSIGFRAPARVEVKEEKSERPMWREYQNSKEMDAEALEQSFVFLGSQYGARTRKDFNGTNEDDQTNEVKKMKVELKTLGTYELDGDESINAMQEAIEAKFAELDGKAIAAESALAEFKTAAGCDSVEAVKAMVERANAGHNALVDEVVKYGALSGLIAQDKVDERKAALAGMSDAELEIRLAEYKAVWTERNPQNGKLPEPKEEKKAQPVIAAGSIW